MNQRFTTLFAVLLTTAVFTVAPTVAAPLHTIQVTYLTSGPCVDEASMAASPDPAYVYEDNHPDFFAGRTGGAPGFRWEISPLADYTWTVKAKNLAARQFFSDVSLATNSQHKAVNGGQVVNHDEEWNYDVVATWTGRPDVCPPEAVLDPQVKFKSGSDLIPPDTGSTSVEEASDVGRPTWMIVVGALVLVLLAYAIFRRRR